MKKLLWPLSALLFALLGGALALLLLPDRLEVRIARAAEERREAPPPPPPDRTGELLRALGELREGLLAVADRIDAQESPRSAELLEAVNANARRAEALSARVDAAAAGLRDEMRTQLRAIAEAAPKAPAPTATAPPPPAPAPPKPPPETAGTPAPKRKSLSELLRGRTAADPRSERVEYALVKGHCRVGFDGVSSLHNFTAKSESVEGSLALRWNDLPEAPAGAIVCAVDSLDSGVAGRDGEIRSNLGAGGSIRAEIVAFGADRAERDGKVTVTARVRFTIRGKSREMPVAVSMELRDGGLLHASGEARLKMSDFDVRPKAKMGLLKVEDEVTIWWDLYAQSRG